MGQAAAVAIHYVDVEVPVAVGAERDAGPVGRGRWGLVGGGAAEERLDVVTIGVHHQQVGRAAGPGGLEHNPSTEHRRTGRRSGRILATTDGYEQQQGPPRKPRVHMFLRLSWGWLRLLAFPAARSRPLSCTS